MPAIIFVIICTDAADEWFFELEGAFTNRKVAEAALSNLRKNFPSHTHKLKPIELKGAVVSQIENNCYIFDRNEGDI